MKQLQLPYWFVASILGISVVGVYNLSRLENPASILGVQDSSQVCSSDEACYHYWQKINQHYPEYLDSYIYLGYWHWQNYNWEESRRYVETGLTLDPTNNYLRIIERLVKQRDLQED